MTIWIRPIGAHGNTPDGASYATAYLGIKAARDAGAFSGTEDLNICGVHLPPTFTSGDPFSLYYVSTIASGASARRKRIIRGDAMPGDPCVIHCGLFQEDVAWTDEGGGVWSKTLWDSFGHAWGRGNGNSAPVTAVFEYDGTDYTSLTYCRSLSECQSTAGSTFVAASGDLTVSYKSGGSGFGVGETLTGGTSGASGTVSAVDTGLRRITVQSWNGIAFAAGESITDTGSGTGNVSDSQQYIQGYGLAGDTWYVHTNDGLAPTVRVCRPGWGWNITRRTVNCIWYGIKFVGSQGWVGGSTEVDTWITDGMEIRHCVFDHFTDYAVLTLPGKNRDVVVDRCDIGFGENGIYGFASTVTLPPFGRDAQNIRITRNYIHDIGLKEWSTITSDNHAIGAQNCTVWNTSGNVIERTGNAIVFFGLWPTYTTTRMSNVMVGRNVVRELHDEGNFQYRFGMDVTDQNVAGTSSGIDATNNLMELNYIDLPTDKAGMGGSICGSGIAANIPTVRNNVFIGGKFAQSSSRYVDYQNNTAIGPADYFVSNGPGETSIVTFEGNTYSGSPTNDFKHGGVNKTTAEWNALGFDA